jgi:tetratricopeptide (TPR) repeat protein
LPVPSAGEVEAGGFGTGGAVRFVFAQSQFLAIQTWFRPFRFAAWSALSALPLFEVSEEPTRPHGRAIVLSSMGEALAQLGRADDARRCWDAALQAFVTLGDSYGQALTLARSGSFEAESGHVELAISMIERSRALREQLGDRAGLADSLSRLGEVHELGGDLERAWATWRRDSLPSAHARTSRRRCGEKLSMIRCSVLPGQSCLAAVRWDDHAGHPRHRPAPAWPDIHAWHRVRSSVRC